MSYSYTEKKRIRKNFGTFAKVMDLPNLVETQVRLIELLNDENFSKRY
mgnify:CR=1 FL=1